MKKNAIVAILIAIILVFSVFAVTSLASASPGDDKVPSWAVAQETMADGTIWYAYAKTEIKDVKTIKINSKVYLTNVKGEVFYAEIVQIFKPMASSEPRNPARIWVEFKNLTMAKGQPETGPAVIFEK